MGRRRCGFEYQHDDAVADLTLLSMPADKEKS